MKYVLLSVILSLIVGASCGQSYYYYKGHRVPISISSTKKTVLERNPIGGSMRTSIEELQIGTMGYLGGRIIEAIEPVVEPSNTAVSNLLYVKLKNINDTLLLTDFAGLCGCSVVRNVKNMPLWYALSTNTNSIGNSIEISNILYETGRFADVDPGFVLSYRLNCIDEPAWSNNGLWNLEVINCCDAWDITKGSSDIVVAVVDTGIDSTHVEFNNCLSGYDCKTGGIAIIYNGFANSDHGTRVAGIVAAAQNNVAISGVAPGVTLMPISHDMHETTTIGEELASGISWAWQHGAHVINNSWGRPGTNNGLYSALLEDAIRDAIQNGRSGLGTIVTFATGNDNVVNYPACANDSIICVGLVNSSLQWQSPSGSGEQIDVVAPGVNLITTRFASQVDAGDSGTSLACPHVSGMAALMLSVNPLLSASQISTIIDTTCTKLSGYTYVDRPHGVWNPNVGYGLINVGKAVDVANDCRAKLIVNRTIRNTGPVTGGLVFVTVGGMNIPGGFELDWEIRNPQQYNISSYEVEKTGDNTYVVHVTGMTGYSIPPFNLYAHVVKCLPTGGIVGGVVLPRPSYYTMMTRVLYGFPMNYSLMRNNQQKDDLLLKKSLSNSLEGQSKELEEENIYVEVYTLNGQFCVGTKASYVQLNNVLKRNLPNGVYIVNLVRDGKCLGKQKIVIL